MVEHYLAKVRVAGSNPVFRSGAAAPRGSSPGSYGRQIASSRSAQQGERRKAGRLAPPATYARSRDSPSSRTSPIGRGASFRARRFSVRIRGSARMGS